MTVAIMSVVRGGGQSEEVHRMEERGQRKTNLDPFWSLSQLVPHGTETRDFSCLYIGVS